MGELDNALADSDKVLEIDPRDAAAYNNRGIAKAGKGDIEGAILDFLHATKIDSKRHEAHTNLGLLRLDQGKLDEARRHFARSISLRPSTKSLIDTRIAEFTPR